MASFKLLLILIIVITSKISNSVSSAIKGLEMKPFKFFFYSPNAIDTGLRSSNQLSHIVFMRYVAISLNKPYDLPCFLVQMLISFNHTNPKCLVFTIQVHLVSEHIWCEDYLVRSFYLKNLQVYSCAVNNILLLNVMSTLFRINESMKKSLFGTELKQLITGYSGAPASD